MGIVKKRELYERRTSVSPELNEETVCISDLTTALIDLSQSLSALEIQNSKAEVRRAYALSKKLEEVSVMMRRRVTDLRNEILTNKSN